MSKKRPQLTREEVLHIIDSKGEFCINPLSSRSTQRLKLLEAMRVCGLVSRKRAQPDLWVYKKGVFAEGKACPRKIKPTASKCRWTFDDDGAFWKSSCGVTWQFIDGGPGGNNYRYCHCCGKPVDAMEEGAE